MTRCRASPGPSLTYLVCILQVFPYADFHDLIRTDNELALAFLWNFVRTLSKRLNEAAAKQVAATFAMAQFK